MELAIIAAGIGSRLESESVNISKSLIRVNNIPLIRQLIDCGIKNGADKIHCIINEESADLKEYLLNEIFPVKVRLIVKSTPGSLLSFFELAPLLTENYFCMAMPVSVFSCEEFSKFISFSIIQENFDGILAISGSHGDEKPLYIESDNNSVITRFSDEETNTEKVTRGLYYFSTNIYNEMPYALSENMVDLRSYFHLLQNRGYCLKAFEFSKITDRVNEIETAEQLLNVKSAQNRQYIDKLNP